MQTSSRPGAGLDLPRQIGRYEAFFLLGIGGMARVYLGMQRGPFAAAKLVVIKQLRQEVAEDEQFLAMFVDEARITLRLNHPNVVHTYDVVAEAPDYYLAMEFLDGQSLSRVLQRVSRERMPLDEQLWMLTQVLAGLHHAHELQDFDGTPLGIVHRDVSPSNVIVCYSGEVKLLDFGIAKASGAIASTQQGVLKGKLGYAAPEQCLAQPADARADVYAVGVMLWEAMARKRRWTGETSAAIFQARIADTEPAIEEIWPAAPEELVAICHRALAREPDARYATALEFQRDLEAYLVQQPRRVGAAEVSALIAPFFAEERTSVRRIIEEHAGGTRSVAASMPAPAALGPGAHTAESESRALRIPNAREASAQTAPAPQPSAPSASSAPVQQNRRGLAILGALGAGAALLAVGLAIASRVAPSAPAAVASNAAAAPAASAAPHATATSDDAANIELRITTVPRGATLTLDGRPLPQNPFDGAVPRDGAEHELVATAERYAPLKRRLRFERDLELELSLVPLVTAPAAPRAHDTSRGVAETRSAPAAAAPAFSRNAGSSEIEPGTALRSGANGRARRSIDEKDPYAP